MSLLDSLPDKPEKSGSLLDSLPDQAQEEYPNIDKVPVSRRIFSDPARDNRQEVLGIHRQGSPVFKTPQQTQQAITDIADVPATVGSLLATPVIQAGAGLAALGSVVKDDLSYGKPLDRAGSLARAARMIQDSTRAASYQPQAPTGQAVQKVVSYPFEKLAEAGQYVGEKTEDITGSPTAGALADTAVNLTPFLLPFLKIGGEAGLKAVRESETYRKMTIPERGLVVQTYDDMVKSGMSEAQLARMNPEYFREAVRKRSKTEADTESVLDTTFPKEDVNVQEAEQAHTVVGSGEGDVGTREAADAVPAQAAAEELPEVQNADGLGGEPLSGVQFAPAIEEENLDTQPREGSGAEPAPAEGEAAPEIAEEPVKKPLIKDQIWGKTRDQYVTAQDDYGKRMQETAHFRSVEWALNKGLPVPPKVAEAYHELTAIYDYQGKGKWQRKPAQEVQDGETAREAAQDGAQAAPAQEDGREAGLAQETASGDADRLAAETATQGDVADPARAVLSSLTEPQPVKALRDLHGKETVAKLIADSMITPLGGGKVGLTKRGAKWLEENPDEKAQIPEPETAAVAPAEEGAGGEPDGSGTREDATIPSLRDDLSPTGPVTLETAKIEGKKIPKESETLPHGIYKTNVKVGDTVESRYAVPAPASMGFKKGHGDELYQTLDEAIKAHKFQAKREAAKVEEERAREAEAAKEAKAQAEREDFDGFGGGLTPIQQGKVKAALTQRMKLNGAEMSRRDAIRKLVADGYTVGDWKGERTLQDKEGAFFSQRQMTKTGIDYAEHLINKASGSGKPDNSTEEVKPADTPTPLNTEDTSTPQTVSKIRALELRNSAEEVTDIKGGLTGWKVVQTDSGAVLVHRTKDEIIPFVTDSKKYADVLKAKMQAQSYAIENPIQIAGAGELPTETTSTPARKIEDFGEKIGGARKDRQASLDKDYSDDEIVKLPLSEIWPKKELDGIEDIPLAALATAARAEIPAKPKASYKVDRWADKVKAIRGLVKKAQELGVDELYQKMGNYSALVSRFIPKAKLLESIDRGQWGRIGSVEEYPESYRYSGSDKVPAPHSIVEIDGRRERFDVGSVADALPEIEKKLGVEAVGKKMAFEVRGRGNDWNINKKGDPLYRSLKGFTDSKEALNFVRSNHGDLVKAWDDLKERENVKERDLRTDENRPRSGADYRKGKDVTPETFQEAFGFRGVEFGNWVGQGSAKAERQGMLNHAFDAMMDLANILNIPAKAMSLNGTLGVGFGSRGSGWASAHFEPSNLVINLTKTRGAGSFAHEWFHALDNYFARQRGGEKTFTGDNAKYRQENYITSMPEPMYVRKDGRMSGPPISKARLEQYRKNTPSSGYYNPENWQIDPNHPQGVRTEVEARFADLVNALDESPMAARSRLIDKGKSDGYWSRTLERAARSFENYALFKMQKEGYHNDYLANVVNELDFKRDVGRYPYLMNEEVQPVAEAFDNLFATVKSRKTDKGIELYDITSVPSLALEALGKIAKILKSQIGAVGDISNKVDLPIEIEVNGKKRPTINSEGNQIHTTEEGTRNFWKWFDDSAAIDDDGKPLVLYHSSGEGFYVFRKRFERDGVSSAFEASERNRFGKGIFFSSDSGVSEKFGNITRGFYLKIDNLVDVNLGGASYYDGTLHDPETGEEYLDDDGKPIKVDQDLLPDELAETHLDDSGKWNTGVAVRGVYESIPSKGKPVPMADTWIVGNPNQIKSVNNRGTFDPNDLNTLHDITDVIPMALHHLETLGKSVYEAGARKYPEFVKAMKERLGDLWDRFKEMAGEVWERVKRIVGNEKGAVGVDIYHYDRHKALFDRYVDILADGDERALAEFEASPEWQALNGMPGDVEEVIDAYVDMKENEVNASGIPEAIAELDKGDLQAAVKKMDTLTDSLEKLTSIKKSVVEEESGPQEHLHISDKERIEEGKRLVESGAIDPRKLAENINNNPQFKVSPEEKATLLYDRQRIKNQYKTVTKRLEDAGRGGSTADIIRARNEIAVLEEAFRNNAQATRFAGTEASAALRLHNAYMDEDYNPLWLLDRTQGAVGKTDIPEHLKKEMLDMSKEIEELQAKLAESAQRDEESAANAVLNRIRKGVKSDKTVQKQQTAEGKAARDKEFHSLAEKLKKVLDPNKLSINLAIVDPEAGKILVEMARLRIIDGITGAKEIVDDIYNEVSGQIDISKRDIQDTIGGYGKTRELSQDEIKKTQREVHRQLRLFSARDDIQEGKVPQHSGLRPDPQSDTVRELTKEIRTLMRESGLDQKDQTPEEQWRTAMDTVHTRQKNRLHDLKKQIEQRKKTEKPLKKLEYDEEAKALQGLVKEAEQTLKEIDEINKLMQKEAVPDETPEMAQLRKFMADTEREIGIEERRLERGAKGYEEKAASGEFTKEKKPSTRPDTPRLEALKKKYDEAKSKYEAAKELSGANDEARANVALKTLEKAVERNEKVLRGEAATEPGKGAPVSKELALRRIYNDSLRRSIKEMKDAQKVPKDPDEIREKAHRSRLIRMEANLDEMLITGNFTKSARQATQYSEETLKIQQRVEMKKAKVEARLRQLQRQNATTPEKIAYYVVKTGRFFVLSGDAVLLKITAAGAVLRPINTTVAEAAGSLNRKLFGTRYRMIDDKAPREGGGFMLKAEAAAYSQWVKMRPRDTSIPEGDKTRVQKIAERVPEMYINIWDTVIRHKMGIEVEGGEHAGEWEYETWGKTWGEHADYALDFFGRLHGGIKAIPYTQEFYRSVQRRYENALRHMEDPLDPVDMLIIRKEAAKDAEFARFGQNSIVMGAYKSMLRFVENHGLVGLASGTALRTMAPIVKVPTNSIMEMLSYVPGVGWAKARSIRADIQWKLGDKEKAKDMTGDALFSAMLENMTADQADAYIRAMKKHTIGLGYTAIAALLSLMGWHLADYFGGFHRRGEKKKSKDLQAEEIGTKDFRIPALLLHDPMILYFQMDAMTKHVIDLMEKKEVKAAAQANKKHEDPPEKTSYAWKVVQGMTEAANGGILEKFPLWTMIKDTQRDAQSADTALRYAELLLAGRITPQYLAGIASRNDKAGTVQVPRKRDTFEHIMMVRFPGTREHVPVDLKQVKRLDIEDVAMIADQADQLKIVGKDRKLLYTIFSNKLKRDYAEVNKTDPALAARYREISRKLRE